MRDGSLGLAGLVAILLSFGISLVAVVEPADGYGQPRVVWVDQVAPPDVRASRCGTVSYGGRAYVLYYKGMGCRKARRRVRRAHRLGGVPGWSCSSGSRFETGGYCKRGAKYFGWHPGD